MMRELSAPGLVQAYALWSDAADRYYRPVYAFSYRMLGDHGLAEDVCQEVFMRAWRGIINLKDAERMRPWLFSITRKCLADVSRKQRRIPLVTGRGARGLSETSSGATNEDWDEDGSLIDVALSGLARETRAVVVLRVMQGISGREVAHLLGLSTATVSRKLHDGLCVLRGLLHRASGTPSATGGVQ